MKEILGYNLSEFFENVAAKIQDFIAIYKMTYKGENYEVWAMDDDTFEYIHDMSEDDFVEMCPDGWWRSATGSNMYHAPIEEFIINGERINAWYCKEHDEFFHNDYSSLSDYMCNHVGASQPKNVCALSVDLAKINGMTMENLFMEYEG